MDFKQLRAFLAVAELGNVTRASEVLHLVQPAVSRQIRLLEEDIGSPLFQRERHGMVLTDAGRTLVPYARRSMLELDRARAEIAGSATGIGGLVTLGLLPSAIDVLSSELVSAVNSAYPGIRVRIAEGYSGTLRGWLRTGEIDAALNYGSDRSADIRNIPLMEEPLWVIAPGKLRLRRSKPMSLKQLTDKPMVLPSSSHGIRALVDHACAVSRVTLDVVVETNALSVQRSLVLGGLGWTILPPIAVADDLRTGELSGTPLVNPTVNRTISIALPCDRLVGSHVLKAVELLTECARVAVVNGAWPEATWLVESAGAAH